MAVQLHWADYVVFLSMIVISCAIGVFYSFGGRSKANNTDYLLGGRQMGLFPVILSLAASYISAIFFLGFPAETYAYGIQYWMGSIGKALGCVVGVILFVPMIYPLKLTSVNEYLYLRYESRMVQMVASLTSQVGYMLFTGIVFYAPGLALEAVSGVPAWVSIIAGIFVAIFYTTLGGIRVVIYTDSFQAVVMLLGMVVVIGRATYVVGGPATVWELNEQYDRLTFFDFDLDPTKRLSFWGLTIGLSMTFSSVYAVNQMAVQRYSSLPTLRQAKIALYSLIPSVTLLTTLACFSGVVIFAYYAKDGCDPLAQGRLDSANKIMMYFAAQALAIPTLPGLFMAAVWAGSLSSASSALNSAAANLWEDFIKRFVNVSDARATLYVKCLVIATGLVSLGLAMATLQVGGNIVEIMGTFAGSLSGPSSALFLLGGFFPWLNWKGASAGVIAGLIYGVWLAFGSFIYRSQHPTPPLPAPVYNCPVLNATALLTPESPHLNATSFLTPEPLHEPSGLDHMYAISFLWLKGIVMVVSGVIMILVSLLTGRRDPTTVPPELLHPWVRRLMGYTDDLEGDQGEAPAKDNKNNNQCKEKLGYPDYKYKVVEPHDIVITSKDASAAWYVVMQFLQQPVHPNMWKTDISS